MENKNKGYFGIGIINPKRETNVGTLWRSANILDASFIFIIGKRIKKQYSDTLNTPDSIPIYHYDTFEQFYENMPKDCPLIGIELDGKSVAIETYTHFERCIYLLGAEDNGIPASVRAKCVNLVQLPKGNYNVAMSGTIIMYDRHYKNINKI